MACSCGGNCDVNLVYACSGAANTGALADQVARTMMRDGTADMTCLAAVGADLSGFLQSARAATRNIVLDGCPVACGKRIFENRKLPFEHYIMTDFGVQKGKTPITGELIEDIAVQVKTKARLKEKIGA
jgi:uncharacterized metal-binding protein